MTPTARTLAQLRLEGRLADVCERRMQMFGKGKSGASESKGSFLRDLFGAFDILAITIDEPGVLGVQTTSGSNHSSRVKKLLGLATVKVWLRSGNRAEVWSWDKDFRGRWVARKTQIALEEMKVVVKEPKRPRRTRRPIERELFG